MKNKIRKIDLETKVDLVLLVIGFCVLMWIVVSHEEVRKGYVAVSEISDNWEKELKEPNNLTKDNFEGRVTDRLSYIISNELALNDESIKICSVNNIDDTTITTFTYVDGENIKEGIFQISNNDKVLFKAVDSVNINEPFTLHEVELKNDGEPSCTVIYGMINNPLIKSININFYNKTMTNIVLGEENTYAYINSDFSLPIVKVEGLDEALNIFYQWDKIYGNEV